MCLPRRQMLRGLCPLLCTHPALLSPSLPDNHPQALDSLRAAMAATPYGGRVDEDTLRWFLLDRKLDVEDAVGKLSKMMRWREEFGCGGVEGGRRGRGRGWRAGVETRGRAPSSASALSPMARLLPPGRPPARLAPLGCPP